MSFAQEIGNPVLTPAQAVDPEPIAAGSSSRTTTETVTTDIVRDAGSESSDEGVRMSPAAARRFARRNMRRTAATPDLVTSLVRPPSPEAFYNAQDANGHVVQRMPRPVAILSQPYGRRHADAGPNRRTGPLLPPHLCSLDIPKKYGGSCIFDMHTLTYVSDPDPNLLCPICHDPLVDPVTTPCDHTFCYRCLRRSIASSPSGTACPIDRELLLWVDCFSAARLVRTQLNCLIVKCPNQGRGCERELRRENVEKHATTECRFREFTCPDTTCDKKLRAKPKDDECHHKEVDCDMCDDKVEETDKELHLLSCPQAKTRCQACWQLVCRSQMDSHHDLECDGIEVGCPYEDLGCPVRTIRGEIGAHSFTCAFHPETPSGVVIRNQREIIQSYSDLTSQFRDMQLRQDETAKRIDEALADGRKHGEGGSGRNDSVFNDNRTMQDLDAGFEEVHQNLTHLEARQSMWTLNQVMPIREEVTELRNNINMIRMHVNWLLNRSREEGRIRAANTTGPTTGIRRDSSGDGPPILPERRRSSSADMDVPRL
ncbi:TRAF-like signal transducer [Pochonia chlamydosporia 170]|uniref:TRAF-like signal transducer n=1 Tax=Pochonia chlamydosporia 170 TaxID=1380566 RepID=A0A179F6L4_METCM|nr:TRAF-like signal transducer [Pochonia chlamydosporia 170]OAQ61078.1 TRAF-like signal transducer [Pochonia chlamydosporia 170]